MEWYKISEKLPEEDNHVLVWRVGINRYDVAKYHSSDPYSNEDRSASPVWRVDAGRWSFVCTDDSWSHIPTRTDPVTLGRAPAVITAGLKFWHKVKDKSPPLGCKLLLGWVEEGEFFYTVARVEPHADDQETLMYTKHCGGLPDVLLTNHYWAEAPSIWPGLPAAMLH